MSPANHDATSSTLKRAVVPVLGIFLGWGVLITQLRHHWGGESYYNFGWFVPFLTLWLLYRNLGKMEPRPPGSLKGPYAIAVVSILLILPFHALSEVNPFWRVPLWVQAGGLCLFTLSLLYGIYGKRGIRAGVFPLFFLCTMIPWPYRLEVMIVQALTKVVVAVAMSGIHALGYPVELAGNSFVLGELQIGVNEACSGIRSLQALFMVTLFLGSLFGQDNLRRILAVVVLPLVVIFINSLRAIFLSLQVIVNGDEAYQAWHDPAGYIAFAASMVLIYACIELLNIGADESGRGDTPKPEEFLARLRNLGPPRKYALFALLPVGLFLSVESWFRWHELDSDPRGDWNLKPPEASDSSARFMEIHPQIAGILGYSYGQRFVYFLPGNSLCEVYYYGYTPENKLASVSSYGHSPLICMEAVGASKLAEFPQMTIEVGEMKLPMQHYLFELNKSERQLHVFWVVWERRNKGIDPEELASLDYRTQWIQLLRGRRDFSRKVLLLSISGLQEEDRVRETVSRLLNQWIEPQSD